MKRLLFVLLTSILPLGSIAQTLPAAAYIPVTASSNGTLRTPPNFISANGLATTASVTAEATARDAAILVAVPSQTGNSGKILTTNGSVTSWTDAISGILQIRSGSATTLDSVVLAGNSTSKEIAWDTTNSSLRLGDGSTLGGANIRFGRITSTGGFIGGSDNATATTGFAGGKGANTTTGVAAGVRASDGSATFAPNGGANFCGGTYYGTGLAINGHEIADVNGHIPKEALNGMLSLSNLGTAFNRVIYATAGFDHGGTLGWDFEDDHGVALEQGVLYELEISPVQSTSFCTVHINADVSNRAVYFIKCLNSAYNIYGNNRYIKIVNDVTNTEVGRVRGDGQIVMVYSDGTNWNVVPLSDTAGSSSSRNLYHANGTSGISLDNGVVYMRDGSGTLFFDSEEQWLGFNNAPQISFGSGHLSDSGGVLSLDWENKQFWQPWEFHLNDAGGGVSQKAFSVKTHSSTDVTKDVPRDTIQSYVLTTNATPTTLCPIAVAASSTVGVHGFVVARRTGGSAGTAEDGAFYEIKFVAKGGSGTAALIGSASVTTVGESQAGWDVTASASGGNINIQVTGATNNNVTWHWTGEVYPVQN